MNKIKNIPLSIGDQVGSVFSSENTIYRGINDGYIDQSIELLNSGLIEKLCEKKLFPKTKISKYKIIGYNLVLEHEKITPVIYPFEWSPEMLRKAALTILDINDIANQHGYEIKDAHPYNIVFHYDTPIFVDFGSFVKKNRKNWTAYDEFIHAYYNTLQLAQNGHHELYKTAFLLNGGGINAFDVAVLVNYLYKLIPTYIGRKIFHYMEIYRRGLDIKKETVFLKSKNILIGYLIYFILTTNLFLFRQHSSFTLRKKIKSFRLAKKTTWGKYHQKSGYINSSNEIHLTPRMKYITNIVTELNQKSILDIAGNQGALSRTFAKSNMFDSIICIDYDTSAVDTLLLSKQPDENFYIACFDIMSEIIDIISSCRKSRFKSDIVLALAVTHHLILTQNFSIGSILKTICEYSKKYALIEFMPLGLWDGHSSPSLPKWYCESWFYDNLSKYFIILNRKKLEQNRILFVCQVKYNTQIS